MGHQGFAVNHDFKGGSADFLRSNGALLGTREPVNVPFQTKKWKFNWI
jgi:hypothetical protein